MSELSSKLPILMSKNEAKLLADWVEIQTKNSGHKIPTVDLANQCKDFLRLTVEALQVAGVKKLNAPAWEPVRKMIDSISASRTVLGFSPTETATFVFSLKEPLFKLMRSEFADNPQLLMDETWNATLMLDQLGLMTTESFQRTREEMINRQQSELLELSTPVVKLWDGVLALPMIGTLDSSRTQVVMENLLQKIMETESEIAIIDITGVPTVDTLVAQHLIKTVTAARLMGAECIISGIRPQIAATIVHLGVELGGVATKASLADAFALALTRMGKTVTRLGAGSSGHSRQQPNEVRA